MTEEARAVALKQFTGQCISKLLGGENQRSRLLSIPGARDIGFGMINGMNTSLEGLVDHTKYLHHFAPEYRFDAVYNKSNWVGVDAAECLLNFAGYSPNTVGLLQRQWNDFFLRNPDPASKCLQFCHSQGAIHTYNALTALPQELRQRIIVVAIAPAHVIPDSLCYKSFNYAVENDIVPKLRQSIALMGETFPDEVSEGYRIVSQEQSELIMLRQLDGGMGHSFQSKSYKQKIEDHIKEHIQCNGRYP